MVSDCRKLPPTACATDSTRVASWSHVRLNRRFCLSDVPTVPMLNDLHCGFAEVPVLLRLHAVFGFDSAAAPTGKCIDVRVTIYRCWWSRPFVSPFSRLVCIFFPYSDETKCHTQPDSEAGGANSSTVAAAPCSGGTPTSATLEQVDASELDRRR